MVMDQIIIMMQPRGLLVVELQARHLSLASVGVVQESLPSP